MGRGNRGPWGGGERERLVREVRLMDQQPTQLCQFCGLSTVLHREHQSLNGQTLSIQIILIDVVDPIMIAIR